LATALTTGFLAQLLGFDNIDLVKVSVGIYYHRPVIDLLLSDKGNQEVE
jgi:hypothetical protein